jgi:SAM-dependent methyltransferase
MTTAYRNDLAYIHDAGFGFVAAAAATAVIETLRKSGIKRGLVVDLGCGSGIFAGHIAAAGYDVLGYDQSAAMVRLARSRVPAGDFRVSSFLTAQIPCCVAVTSMGEVFNYLFDPENKPGRLPRLFERVYEALAPGGWFIFDVATPGRGGQAGSYRTYREGADWACLVSCEEDKKRRILTREITSFRKKGTTYQRDEEVHRLRLYDPVAIAAQLRKFGFSVRMRRGYKALRLPRGTAVFFARKP